MRGEGETIPGTSVIKANDWMFRWNDRLKLDSSLGWVQCRVNADRVSIASFRVAPILIEKQALL